MGQKGNHARESTIDKNLTSGLNCLGQAWRLGTESMKTPRAIQKASRQVVTSLFQVVSCVCRAVRLSVII